MSLKHGIKQLLNAGFKRHGWELVPCSALFDWQRTLDTPPRRAAASLPPGAEAYLRPDNPRLNELEKRYARLDSAATVPCTWNEGHVAPDDLLYFRGDNAYVWQSRGLAYSIVHYALATFYLKATDPLGLLDRLEEDGSFGNYNLTIADRKVSRDLLDSITEIGFLNRHLNVAARSDFTILDIGAGYGRLAHRMLDAFPAMQTYICTDAVAASTFLCEYYLRFRGLSRRARVAPLDEIEDVLNKQPVDLAVNIHSFSECSLPAIDWWLSLIARHEIKHLLIVPNPMDHGGERLLTDERHDIRNVVEAHGYRLQVQEPKYRDPVVQHYGLRPTVFHLFERR